ncbi:ribonuclease H-like domain-containing protein [Tanacetum coccineum]
MVIYLKFICFRPPAVFETYNTPDHVKKYAVEILERARMANCNPCRTLFDTESKLGNDGDPFALPVCNDPREPHFSALKRILRYVRGTLDYGLQLFSSFTTSLVAYSDADWAGCPTTWRSRGEYRGVTPNAPNKIPQNAVAEKYLVAAGQVRVLMCLHVIKYAIFLLKILPSALFEELSFTCIVRPVGASSFKCDGSISTVLVNGLGLMDVSEKQSRIRGCAKCATAQDLDVLLSSVTIFLLGTK